KRRRVRVPQVKMKQSFGRFAMLSALSGEEYNKDTLHIAHEGVIKIIQEVRARRRLRGNMPPLVAGTLVAMSLIDVPRLCDLATSCIGKKSFHRAKGPEFGVYSEKKTTGSSLVTQISFGIGGDGD
ncbi:hypothetical protein ACJX0J_034384, partial [Zea mays]